MRSNTSSPSRVKSLFSFSSRRYLLPLFGLLHFLPSESLAASAEVLFRLIPSEQVLTMGEPIFVTLEVKNNSSELIKFDLGRNQVENLVFTLTGPGGEVFEGPRLRPSGIYLPGEISLLPQSSFSKVFLVSDWFEVEEVGRYTLHLGIAPDRPDEGSPFEVLGPVYLEIAPRDPGKLSKACRNAAEDALHGNAEEQLDASKTLAHLSDVICISLLGQVLRESDFGKEGAIKALSRIDHLETIRAVVDSWDGLRWDQQRLVKRDFTESGRWEALLEELVRAGKGMKEAAW
jgi:hypothetical protein